MPLPESILSPEILERIERDDAERRAAGDQFAIAMWRIEVAAKALIAAQDGNAPWAKQDRLYNECHQAYRDAYMLALDPTSKVSAEHRKHLIYIFSVFSFDPAARDEGPKN